MKEYTDFQVDTRVLLQALRKKARFIALVCLVSIGITVLAGTLLTGKTYTAKITFRVETDAETLTAQTLSVARDLTDSCAVLLHTQICLDEVSELTGIAVTDRMFSGAAVDETEFFCVTVRCRDAEAVGELAQAMETVLPQLAEEHLSGGRLILVDSAGVPQQLRPDLGSLCAMGLLLGLLLGIGTVTLGVVSRSGKHTEAG